MVVVVTRVFINQAHMFIQFSDYQHYIGWRTNRQSQSKAVVN